MGWDSPGSERNLNSPNRPVRTRMPGGVAGSGGVTRRPYADSEEPVQAGRFKGNLQPPLNKVLNSRQPRGDVCSAAGYFIL